MNLESGKFYLWKDGAFVRQIIQFNGDAVIYRDFSRRDGEPMSDSSTCSIKTFKNGVTGELPQSEIPMMQVKKSKDHYSSFVNELASLVLHTCPIEDLIKAVEERGYIVTKK